MAKYRALSDGFLSKPVSVIRNGEKIHKSFIKSGDIFEYDGPKGSWMKVIEESEPENDERQEIMDKLKELEIPFHHKNSLEKLKSMLPE